MRLKGITKATKRYNNNKKKGPKKNPEKDNECDVMRDAIHHGTFIRCLHAKKSDCIRSTYFPKKTQTM